MAEVKSVVRREGNVNVLPHDMKRDVRAPRIVAVTEPVASSVYVDLDVNTEFWTNVLERYQASLVEQRPTTTLLRANVATHGSLAVTPEATVLRQYADHTGFMSADIMPDALSALGADCTPEVAKNVVTLCSASGHGGLTEPQFAMLADAIRGAASQCSMATRLRARNPEGDAVLRVSIARNLVNVAEELSDTPRAGGGGARTGSPSANHWRSSSVRSGARRATSPSRQSATSMASVGPGVHTLKSLASLRRQQEASLPATPRRSAGRQTPKRSTTPRRAAGGGSTTPTATGAATPRSGATPRVNGSTTPRYMSPRGTGGMATPRSTTRNASASVNTNYAASFNASAGRSASKRTDIPEPTLDTVASCLGRHRPPRATGVRNAITTRPPKVNSNRFDVPRLSFA